MHPGTEAIMAEGKKQRIEMPAEERHVLATHIRMLEEFSQRLAELFRPVDSCLVYRLPLSHENAEQLQRVYSHLRSRISQAAWDLGLPRTNQDSREELESLVMEMGETLEGLESISSRVGTPAVLEAYLTQLATDLRRIVNDIDRVAGTKPESTSAVRCGAE